MWFGIELTMQLGMMALFALGHAAIGILILYTVLAGYLNKTVVSVSSKLLTVQHGSLPWPGNKQLYPTSITQIYCKEHISHGRRSVSYTYQVHAVTTPGTDDILLRDLERSEQAHFIEQEIERFLGIKDWPVRGELPH